MERSGYGIASDVKYGTHEASKFPIICESCLGDNPYVRMIKDASGKECKICARPYDAFRWKPGPKARYKQTIVCQTCSKLKNVCQTCLFDLEYGLPVQVRDKYLEEHLKLELPTSHVNRDYMVSQLDKLTQDNNFLPYGKSSATHAALQRIARTQPYYRRNRPRVCTFWLRGACSRGDECPFLHEEDNHDPALADQNIRDRYVGQDDPVANKILRKAQQASTAQSLKPQDVSVKTLHVGGLSESINEHLLREKFIKFGGIQSIKIIPRLKSALITFFDRDAAEDAVEELFEKLEVNGVKLRLNWGKSADSSGSSKMVSQEADEPAASHSATSVEQITMMPGYPPQQPPYLEGVGGGMLPPHLPPPYPYRLAQHDGGNRRHITPSESGAASSTSTYGGFPPPAGGYPYRHHGASSGRMLTSENQGGRGARGGPRTVGGFYTPHSMYASMNPAEAEHRR